jgi:hypothetical protein
MKDIEPASAMTRKETPLDFGFFLSESRSVEKVEIKNLEPSLSKGNLSLKNDKTTRKRSPNKSFIESFALYKDADLPLITSADFNLQIHDADGDDDVQSEDDQIDMAKEN